MLPQTGQHAKPLGTGPSPAFFTFFTWRATRGFRSRRNTLRFAALARHRHGDAAIQARRGRGICPAGALPSLPSQMIQDMSFCSRHCLRHKDTLCLLIEGGSTQ